MKTIKQIVEDLPELIQRALLYALEHDISYKYDLGNGKFIGVNINERSIKILQQSGSWIIGEK